MKRSELTLVTLTAAARAAPVKTATSPLGRIIVDSRGRTLYLFEKDLRGHSACAGACAAYWPPLLAHGRPTAGRGAKQSLLGITRPRPAPRK